jgi:tetratricopeptide (TPR) repeat protein
LLLVAITAFAGAAFLFTRAMAAKERRLNQHVAATWFAEGKRQLGEGDTKRAIDSFRRATSSNYENRVYRLALANALATAGHFEEARYALLQLRDSVPESAEVNLDLARLASKRGDVAEVAHYYHNALYGLWTGTEVDRQQREVRMELIRFLLGHQQYGPALSELLILETDLPEKAAIQTDVGQLFLDANDANHALRHFTRALRSDKHDPAALAGAGDAAFRLSDYSQARRYLEGAAAGSKTERVQELLSLTTMILSNDPLSPHLTPGERTRRLRVGFEQAFGTLEACIGHPGNRANHADLDALYAEAIAMRPHLKVAMVRRDAEVIDTGIELIARIEEAVKANCGEPEGFDRALLLIGHKHGGVLP